MSYPDGQRGREARQLIDDAMRVNRAIDAGAAHAYIVTFTDMIEHVARIEAILRANRLHEPTCASLQPVWLPEPAHAIPRPPCNCWLTGTPDEDGAA